MSSYGQMPDEQLIEMGPNAFAEREMIRRLKEAVNQQTASLLESQKTTNDLTASIKTLTVVLVVLTVFIALLTVVMAWPTVAAWLSKASGR